MEVYALGDNGALKEIYQTGKAKEGWSDWVDHGGNIAELVAVTQDPEGRIVVYGIGKRGGMEEIHQSIPAGGPWTNWSSRLGGGFTPN